MDVTFMCKDGVEKKCDSTILAGMSQFFKEKIEGHKRLGNPLIFNYDKYDGKIVKAFLDSVYSIPKPFDQLSPLEKVLLIDFLLFEGKSETSGNGDSRVF